MVKKPLWNTQDIRRTVDLADEASCFHVIRAVDLRGSSGESETHEFSKDMPKEHRSVDRKLMDENVSGCWADRDESLDKNRSDHGDPIEKKHCT